MVLVSRREASRVEQTFHLSLPWSKPILIPDTTQFAYAERRSRCRAKIGSPTIFVLVLVMQLQAPKRRDAFCHRASAADRKRDDRVTW